MVAAVVEMGWKGMGIWDGVNVVAGVRGKM
jgi:hypothetical protein